MLRMPEELREQADPVGHPQWKGFGPVREITNEETSDKAHYVKFSCWYWLNFGSLSVRQDISIKNFIIHYLYRETGKEGETVGLPSVPKKKKKRSGCTDLSLKNSEEQAKPALERMLMKHSYFSCRMPHSHKL